MHTAQDYLNENPHGTDFYYPSILNIVLIETESYAGNFEQEICEAVFGTPPSYYYENIISNENYLKTMKNIGYDRNYFYSKRQISQNYENDSVIAGMMRTPLVKEYTTVGLFFKEKLSQKDLDAIKTLIDPVLKKHNAQLIGIDQMFLETKTTIKD